MQQFSGDFPKNSATETCDVGTDDPYDTFHSCDDITEKVYLASDTEQPFFERSTGNKLSKFL